MALRAWLFQFSSVMTIIALGGGIAIVGWLVPAGGQGTTCLPRAGRAQCEVQAERRGSLTLYGHARHGRCHAGLDEFLLENRQQNYEAYPIDTRPYV